CIKRFILQFLTLLVSCEFDCTIVNYTYGVFRKPWMQKKRRCELCY
ncbi:unnamed protein product, partial [Musa acuminata subsp. burmannicoides]